MKFEHLKGNDAEVVKELSTSVKYISGECGHRFKGTSKPRLYFLPSSFEYGSIESIPTISVIFKRCLDTRNEDEIAILCSTLPDAELSNFAIQRLERTAVSYVPYLKEEYPDITKKLELIKSLETTDSVLISDYRGCRGLEFNHSIILADPNDIIGVNLLVEMLSRTISKLDIIVLPIRRTQEDLPSTIERTFQKYKDQNLVDVTEVQVCTNMGEQTTIEIQLSDGTPTDPFEETVTKELRKKQTNSNALS